VSFQLPSALFAVAFSFGLSDRRQRQAWWLLAGGIFAALLVTGTRSALLLLLVPLVVVLVSPGRQRRRAIQSVAVAGISVILVFNLAGAVAGVATDWTSQRLFTVQDVIAAPESDASLGVRLDQSAESWELFEANPLLGVGPGHIFHWTLHGEVRQSFTVDTSVSYLAKFGAGGLAILIAFFFIVARLVRDGLAEGNGLDEGLAALLAFSVVTLTVATLGAPLEDKGFAISLVLLLVLAFKREAEGRRSAASRSRPQSPHRLKVV
jgi:O-antigen ligase